MDDRHDRSREAMSGSGFTLVELLVVIVVLGILSTVTVFAVRGLAARAEDSSCAADRKTLEVALATYEATAPSGAVVTESDIVSAGLLRSASDFYDIAGDQVVPAPNNTGNCT